ncbi:hypothetical protein V1522DRAFT_414960 [Lipomyces starkeyi]
MISDATISWQLLDIFHAKVQTSLCPLMPYITSFSITIPSSWGEWHRSEVLQAMLEKCFNICFLQLTLSGSQASSRIALFDVADLQAFKAVEELQLDHFRLQGEYPIEERAVPLLNTVLNVHYTIKSEAFKSAEIYLDLFSPVRQKSWYPSLRGCTDLESVSLKGFRRPPIEFFEALPDSLMVIELYFALLNFFDNPCHVTSYDNTGGPIISKYGSKTIRLMHRDMRTLNICSI